jgi:ubiquinone/menaquinone biosynthesis C-methylase UbiE
MDPYQELTLYQRSAVLMAAAKLGAFQALSTEPVGAGEIAARMGIPLDSAQRLLGSLLALGYIAGEKDRYRLNAFSASFLRDGAGGMLRLAWKEHIFYTAWSRLADALQSGRPLFPSYRERMAGDFPSVEKFLLALNDLAQAGAAGVIATGAFGGATTILDLGGGGGGYAAELTAALPWAKVTLADLPEILPLSLGHLTRKGLAAKVERVPADFLVDGCGLGGRTFDRVLLSHILHDFEPATAAAIVARAAKLVAPQGRLVVLDVLVPEGGERNPVEGLFDLMMLVEVPGGRCHGQAEVRQWMAAAGLTGVAAHKLYFGCLVDGRRE